LKFLVATYVNTPLTLIIVTVLSAIAHSNIFSSLSNIISANRQLLSLAISALFISVFLIINRKGAISQIIGILSLENSIVVFAIFAGLEQAPALQMGIIFDIFIWIIIATVFIRMIYKHFGSLDVTEMRELTD
jgi:hydrogenase-4 component E